MQIFNIDSFSQTDCVIWSPLNDHDIKLNSLKNPKQRSRERKTSNYTTALPIHKTLSHFLTQSITFPLHQERHPEVDIWTFMQGSSFYFRNYVERGLREVADQRKLASMPPMYKHDYKSENIGMYSDILYDVIEQIL